MALFIPVILDLIVSKNNKQTKKNMPFISVSHIHIHPEKKHEKNTKMTFSDVPR